MIFHLRTDARIRASGIEEALRLIAHHFRRAAMGGLPNDTPFEAGSVIDLEEEEDAPIVSAVPWLVVEEDRQ
jgi:hypothetical protein